MMIYAAISVFTALLPNITDREPLIQITDLAVTSKSWSQWSPRAEIAPRFQLKAAAGRDGRAGLAISTAGSAEFGAWRNVLTGITPGKSYRFTAYYKAHNVPFPQRSVSARLDWRDARGGQPRPPDYILDAGSESGWTKIGQVCAAPEGASSVTVELALGWCAHGEVVWGDISFVEESAPRNRVIRAMTIFHRPTGTKSAADSVEQFCRIAEQHSGERPDIVCLPEGITVVGTGKSYADVCEAVPGPTTTRLGELARVLHSYVVGGLYERVGNVIYNTAVLIGRDGKLVGTYRKTHLPREEVEGGLTPGDSYPVFETDFGKVGLMICWDVQFPEPARALALKGAEVILLPIWGGNEVLAKARAIENHIFLISSSYDMKTFIVNPAGEVLAEASKDRPAVCAEIRLDQKIVQPWLGDMKPRTWKERRPDITIEPYVKRP